MSKYSIKQIFKDNWYSFLFVNPTIRNVVCEEVDKTLSCGDMSKGFAVYGCEHCGNFKVVPFRCKSRFCNTCGAKYSSDRANSMSLKMVNCIHRHCVFTIPEQLRIYFRKDRTLLNTLFSAVNITLSSWFAELNKKENFKPGFILTLHTFGRDLKWNPHIHAIITEGASGNSTIWRKINHFPFVMLRKRFMTVLLNLIENHLNDTAFKKVKAFCYKEFPNGFYVYAKSNVSDPKQVMKYVTRYTGRPVMANSRIINYDGHTVTFFYERHEDGKRVVLSLPVFDFIKKLIIHIPDRQFKMVRYYGIYAKPTPNSKHLIKLTSNLQKTRIKKHSNWRFRIAFAFNYDPLACSCGHSMCILEIYHNKVSLFRPYFDFYSSA
ncbi:MAG TPA: IS91 family transposase [Clostridiales bacterium]|nr:IS91 family transposase [Clostridiales bacterium]